ncbi:FBP domain-containing protein [Oryzihumus leptocrescens]|uniref:Treble-clef zinc-finger protein n=1 Tax=Oryzihumus leptocrescens TaxID=297536 RepID=A0A542ZEQ6_9MICO|nr:FBP domain-containing protein [Oryzihumus leptocrescens]TQL58822.1 treble-clef zinc-finger protein [Oryzihumus leptocrescens]
MEPLTAAAVRGSFVNLSKTQAKALNLPAGLEQSDWDTLDYLGWRDPKAPARAYLVLWRDGKPLGLALRAPSTSGSRGSALCNLCWSAHKPSDVVLFVAPRAGSAGRDGNTVGTYICADLACSLYVRGLRPLELPQGESMVEPAERARRLTDRLGAFVDRVLA